MLTDEDLRAVKAFKEKVAEEMKCRFKPNNLHVHVDFGDKAAVLASAFDLRYHQLNFLGDGQRSAAYTSLKEKVKEVQSQSEGEQTQQSSGNDSQTTATERMIALSFQLNKEAIDEAAIKQEVNKYLSKTSLKCDANCPHWWKQNIDLFPLLSKIAKQYICTPATSVPGECILSKAGFVISQQTTRLKPENVSMLIFLT